MPAADALPDHADVVVVGAGLAGLATALHLERAGRHVVVVEASDAAGGRIRTDEVDGFLLDRGFQLYNPAYPEGRQMLDAVELDLKSFERGAIVAGDSGRWRVADPRQHPTWVPDALRAGLGGPLGLLRLGWYGARCATSPPRRLATRTDVATVEALQTAGADDDLLDHLLAPFLRGVFLESDLATSRRFGDLILRSFVRGTPGVPARGMQALPMQLAAQVADLHLNQPALSVAPGYVRLTDAVIGARAVVVAVGPGVVADLLPSLGRPETRSCTTWYHRPDQAPGDLSFGYPLLTVESATSPIGPLVNSAVLTHAAPSYAPPGASLVSSTALDLHGSATDDVVRAQLAHLYGVDTSRWELIARYEVADALPAMLPPLQLRRPIDLGEGLFVAGDHRDTASIQGALVSGRRAAAAVTAYLDGRRTPTSASAAASAGPPSAAASSAGVAPRTG